MMVAHIRYDKVVSTQGVRLPVFAPGSSLAVNNYAI